MQMSCSAVDIQLDIALLLERWQCMVNLMAQLAQVPCVLINRVQQQEICVQVASSIVEQPFHGGERIPLPLNSYCSHVIATQQPLLVENASGTCFEPDNPTYSAGFSYYYGLPLCWPDGQIFGTVCMLDTASAGRAVQHRALLTLFQQAIEYDLKLLRDRQALKRRELVSEQRFIQLFSQVCQSLTPNPAVRSKLLQSELFVLLTGQYQYWHQTLEQQLTQVTEHSVQSLQVVTLVRLWSNLLAIAQQTEWLALQTPPADVKASATAAQSQGAESQDADSEVKGSEVKGVGGEPLKHQDATPLLEQAVYQSALTLGADVTLRSHLPSPLLLPGPAELWSLLGLAVSSFLILGSAGRQRTVFLSWRSLSMAPEASSPTPVQASAPQSASPALTPVAAQQVLEWSLLQKEQTTALQFGRDNQALFGFAAVCAELAGASLETSADTIVSGRGVDMPEQSRYIRLLLPR